MKRAHIAVMIGLALLPLMAWGQQKGAIELTSIAEVEILQKNEKGKEELKRVEASKANVAPGDTVIFSVRYVNNGDKPAADVVIKNPVPQHMAYVRKSAGGAGARIDFSIDGGKTYATADKLNVKGADGKERTALASEYTHIRWTMEKPVVNGGKGLVFFRAKVK
jgi:uncharacterized repeat protein (TIGR01451 family)